MHHALRRFFRSEDGAVSVDWVVITAAVVGMSAISFAAIENSADDLMTSAGDAVADQDDF